ETGRGARRPGPRRGLYDARGAVGWHPRRKTNPFARGGTVMTMPVSTSVASNSVDRATFENFYSGAAPWDIGRPQGTLVAIADRVTSPVLDAGCGPGEHALFLA